ncbi:plastin-2-like, partial [Pempheris klunzingeri]|uniref:plastin-2-like n=1 Tax=Pempheris klunzingeri TaxID=3127111 RepID=UPI00397F538A
FSEGGLLGVDQLNDVFAGCGAAQPSYKLREIIDEFDVNKDGKIDFEEFCNVFLSAETNKVWGAKLRQNIKERAGIAVLDTHEKSAEGTKHSVLESDIVAFAIYINNMLKNDPVVNKTYLPIEKNSTDLFEKVSDGVLFCKMVNLVAENTIDERTINTKKLNQFTKTENLNLALNSFRAIGIHIVNVGAQDIMNKTSHLVLGIVWQIIRLVLLKKISLQFTPGLACLLRPGEDIKMLMALSPEELLMRWVNYHLEKAGSERTISNFGSDLKDSEVYAHLFDRTIKGKNITPHSQIMQ